MKRTVWTMAAVGIVLLGLAACGSAAPESPDENTLFAANGPALTVVEKQPDQYTTDPEDKTVPPEQSPDLLTMNSQEEEGFALFYPLLSETQFRCLMDEDGVDFIPNRLVSCEEGGLAYYSTAAGDLVYCTADFSTVKAVLCQQRVGLIIDARWLDADHLLFLQGNENEQAVYLFRPAEDMVELLYQSPEGRQILGIELDENGQPVCILSALPQLEESDPTPAPEENGTDNTNSGTKSDESSGENPASNAKDWSSSLWDDEEDSEKSELGDANAGEESAIPTEKVELDMTAASTRPAGRAPSGSFLPAASQLLPTPFIQTRKEISTMSFFPRLIVALRKPVVMAVKKPTPLTYIGAGRLRQAAELLRQTGSHRVLVMTTPGMMRRGQLDQTLSELKENGMEAVVFDRVSPDPTFGVVEEAVSCAAGCDAILAVGGGSVLDAAKTAAAAIANHKPAEKLVGTLKVKKQPMPLIAVPTTAGTGSETTIAAVISGTATHRKRQILDPKLVPFAAILDPELTVGLPQGNTIHTAMDALTHALEAYVSTYATPETDRYAEMAAKMIYEALPVVREEPKNVEMREQLLVASFLAGMAFTRTYVGYVHAFAHSIGGRYGVAHGLANAVLLPHIMEYYLPVSTPRLARMAQICGISGDSDESTRARAFVESIAAMNQTGGVPERLAEFPRAEIDAVIKEAFQECHGTYPVPRYYTRPAARALLEQVCAE